MWIRTQSQDAIIRVDGLFIEKEDKHYKISTDNYYVLGRYKTEEMCLKILDGIDEHINNGYTIFQMPLEKKEIIK